MGMRRIEASLFLLLMLILIPSSITAVGNQKSPETRASQYYSNIERNWTTNIILVNYDSLLINDTTLLETVPLKRVHYTATTLITYNIHYNLYVASDAYADALRQIILDYSTVGSEIGTSLNETALAIQRDNPNTRIQVFGERAGRSIDGYAVEEWLMDNPFVPAPNLGYNFYILNLSEFDSPDHSMEHWFDYHPMDPDTGIVQNWFRLEFDNNLNPPIMMQYAGIGGRGNVYVLDPSADQWYMRWARIWWHEYISTEYEHWTMDLEDKSSELDLETIEGVQFLNEYLRDYLNDIVSYLLFPYQHSPAKYVTSGEIKIEVIKMDEDDGLSLDDLEWVTNAEKQQEYLKQLLPFIDWNVSVGFLDSSTDTFWNNTFWSYASINTEGVTEVAGSSLFDYLFENVRPYRMTTGPDNINVYGVVFIKRNMLMSYGDGTYTGLGINGPDGGLTLVCKSLERYFCSDNITPREGVSGLQLHELMHAIGFAHTWQDEHYASDFNYGPMGYFAVHNGTSSFDKNWAQGTYLDQMEIELLNDFIWKQGYLSPDDPDKTFIAESRAIQAFANAREKYNQMKWLEAYEELRAARDWTKRMIYSRIDGTPPLIDDWGTIPSTIDTTAFTYWVHVTDRSGLENVTLYAKVDGNITTIYECSYENPNWCVFVPGLIYHSNLTLWIVAWDWGMNKAEGGFITISVGPESSFIQSLMPLIIMSGIAGIVIVLGITLKRRP